MQQLAVVHQDWCMVHVWTHDVHQGSYELCIECGEPEWADSRPFEFAVETHAYLKEQIKPDLQRRLGVAINAAADEMIASEMASEPKPVDESKTLALFPRTEMDPRPLPASRSEWLRASAPCAGSSSPTCS